MFEKHYIQGVGSADDEFHSIKIEKRKQALKTERTQEFMIMPLYKDNKELFGFIQTIANPKKPGSTFLKGFTVTDELFLGILGTVLMTKLEQIHSQ